MNWLVPERALRISAGTVAPADSLRLSGNQNELSPRAVYDEHASRSSAETNAAAMAGDST